jgi:hypothetical protein
MPALPKPLFVLRTSWQTARMARRLQRANTAAQIQQQTLTDLLGQIAVTAYGRDLGITPTMSYDEFKSRVPVRDHDQLSPYFQRIKDGEPNVLWPGHCHWYVESAGTTGKPKWLPVTPALLDHFEKAEADALLYYTARIGDSDVFRGRHVSLSPLLTLLPVEKTGATAAAESAPATSPSWGAPQLAEILSSDEAGDDWSKMIEAIVTRTLRLDITLLAGIPPWLLTFGESLRSRAARESINNTSLKTIWPGLECIVHHGIPISPYQDELKRTAGPSVNFHEIYFASEAFIAAQDADTAAGLRLMEDSGVFYEFLPLRDFEESLPLTLASKALSLPNVRKGENYVLLVTTPAGLCRYVVGDIVRFASIDPPRIIHVGRTQLRLNAFEENVQEKELTDSIVAVCQRHGWTITNFHVAPQFVTSLTGQSRGRHEWWVELRPGTNQTPTGPLLAAHIDADLVTRSESYAAKRQNGRIEAPVVRLVMPRFFAHWLEHQKKWGGQKRMPRCRSDRLVADEFAALACFNAD